MSKSKSQHWVPEFYLRYFATAETRDSSKPRVWVFFKNGGAPQLINVKKVAKGRYLYTPKRKDGTRDWQTDEMLQDLESLLGGIWPQLETGFTDLYSEESFRKIIALFVATLYLRPHCMVQQVKEIHRQLVAFYEQVPKDERGNPMISEVDHRGIIRPFDNFGYQEYKHAGPDRIHQMFVDDIQTNAIWFAEAILEKRWSVIFADEPVFVTTDTPVTISNLSRHPFGVKTPGTVLSFSLSPTRILFMDDRHDQPEGRYYPLGAHGPAPFNLMAWQCCERRMISPRHTDMVCREMLDWAEALGESHQT